MASRNSKLDIAKKLASAKKGSSTPIEQEDKTAVKKKASRKKTTKKIVPSSDIFADLKKETIQYSQFRMHTHIYEKLVKISKKENLKYPANLIHRVLELYIAQYEAEKGKVD